MAKRTEHLLIRVAPEEMSMLRDIADADGIKMSDVVRMFVRREYALRFGARKLGKSKK